VRSLWIELELRAVKEVEWVAVREAAGEGIENIEKEKEIAKERKIGKEKESESEKKKGKEKEIVIERPGIEIVTETELVGVAVLIFRRHRLLQKMVRQS
jgi:hypothetical protein